MVGVANALLARSTSLTIGISAMSVMTTNCSDQRTGRRADDYVEILPSGDCCHAVTSSFCTRII